MEKEPLKVIVIEEDSESKEKVEIYSNYVRFVDYEYVGCGYWEEAFSHCVPLSTIKKIIKEADFDLP